MFKLFNQRWRGVSVTGLAVGIVMIASLLASTARADRTEIEATLAAMTHAVRAGDAAAYLKLVDLSDERFAKEQSNWAKDLTTHIPSAFELAIQDDAPSPPDFGDKESRFELVIKWTVPGPVRSQPKGDDAEKKPAKDISRTLSFPARFVRAASEPQAPDETARGSWLFAGEAWETLQVAPDAAQSPAKPAEKAPEKSDDAKPHDAAPPHPQRGVIVRFYPGYEEVAQRIVNVLPDIRAHVDEGFQIDVNHPQEIKLYPSMKHLQQSIYLSYVDGLGGWNEPDESIKLLVRPTTPENALKPLLAHEYGHVATFELGPKANDMPWWVLEGVAELSAEHYSPGKDPSNSVIRWHSQNRLAKWSDLSDFRSVPSDMHAFVYVQGEHMLGYFSQRFGRSGRNAWLGAMANGKTIDQATQEVAKMSFDDLDREWREHVAQLALERARPEPQPDAKDDADKPAKPPAPKDKPAE